MLESKIIDRVDAIENLLSKDSNTNIPEDIKSQLIKDYLAEIKEIAKEIENKNNNIKSKLFDIANLI